MRNQGKKTVYFGISATMLLVGIAAMSSLLAYNPELYPPPERDGFGMFGPTLVEPEEEPVWGSDIIDDSILPRPGDDPPDTGPPDLDPHEPAVIIGEEDAS